MDRLKTSTIVLVGCGALLAGAIACSAGGSTAGGGQATSAAPATQAAGADPLESMDPCAILTQDDATAFFGAAAPAGQSSQGNPGFCVYQTADNAKQLGLHIVYLTGSAAGSDAFVAAKKGVQDVPGLGDAAYFNPVMSEIGIAKGSWSLTINGILQDGKASLEALTPAAQAALGRLP